MSRFTSLFAFLSVLACGLTFASGAHAASMPACTGALFAGGNGTQGNPWQIATAQQLANITSCANDSETMHYYILTAPIDLETYIDGMDDEDGWWPIGSWYDDADGGQWTREPFYGHFNGNGHTISNLFINRDDFPPSNQGLFWKIAEGSTVTDLGLLDVDVTGASDTGAFAGSNNGTISRSFVIGGSVTSSDWSAGGMVGSMEEATGRIEDSYAIVNVTAEENYASAGGIAGSVADGSSMTNVYASTTISVLGGASAGGITAGNWGVANYEVQNSFAIISVGDAYAVGGIGGKWGDATESENNFWLVGDESPSECSGTATLASSTCDSIDSFSWFTSGLNEPMASWDIEIRNDPSIALMNGGLPVLAWQIDGPGASATWLMHGVPAAPTYTLSFDSQGGSIVADMAGIEEDEDVTLPAAPTRSGYTFAHWYTNSAGTGGTAYAAGATYVMGDDDATLYAIWTPVVEEAPRSGNRPGQKRSTPSTVTVTTPSTPSVPTAPGSVCSPYLKEFIRLGAVNNPEEVKKLETFLNEKQGETLTVDGVYTAEDAEAVKRFQKKFASEVLGVWGLSEPTGYVYRTTLMKINSFYCSQSITCPAFTEFNSLTENTTSAEVARTKVLLTELGFYTGAISDVFDQSLKSALTRFQETFSDTMLKPWGLTSGTGYKYKTTNKFLNLVVGCQTGAVDLDGQGVFDY